MGVWHQIVVEGSEKILRAFLTGLEEGAGEHGRWVLGSDLEMESESLGDRIRAFFESDDHGLVFAQPKFADAIVSSLERRGEGLGLAARERHEVVGARFPVRAETFSEEAAAAIHSAIVEHLPDGVTVIDLSESSDYNPDARGAELYAPDHPFTYRLQATVTGTFPGVVEVHRRGLEMELVQAGRITLHTKQLAFP